MLANGLAFVCKACLLSNDAYQRNGNLAGTSYTKCPGLLVKDDVVGV